MKRVRLFLFVVCIGLLVACNSPEETPSSSDDTGTTQVNTDTSANEAGDTTSANNAVTSGSDNAEGAYPGAVIAEDTASGAYPSGILTLPEGASETPPDPDRTLPEPTGDTGAVGGVIIREVSEDGGFMPVLPVGLYLGEVIYDDQGTPLLIGRGDDAPSAEVFQTGVFLFNEVPPGEYGLVIDLGFSEFLLKDDNGKEYRVVVEAGQAQDLGQVMVFLPTSDS